MPPASPAAQPDPALIASVIATWKDREGPLLPILHALQDAFGFIPAEAQAPICTALRITKAELHGVISFYHDFREAPAGRHVLKLCRAEACQAMGAPALHTAVLEALGLDWHGTSADGRVTVEPVYCLGLCACAPAAMLDERVIGRADPARIETALAEGAA
ncbi:formate dehydrogenase subunit gamma [Pseudooceanicola sp. C21-150M6]|uniref:formate dehydrogenase subunit gamma n=1 Tax=Pseudooceanicola sp. C21-150M6 TaxID=3434355 RepID=UPI003D7FAAF8